LFGANGKSPYLAKYYIVLFLARKTQGAEMRGLASAANCTGIVLVVIFAVKSYYLRLIGAFA